MDEDSSEMEYKPDTSHQIENELIARKNDLASLRIEYERVGNELIETRWQKNEYKSKMDELEHEIQEMWDNLDDSKSQISDLLDSKSELERRRDFASKEIKSLTMKLGKIQSCNNSLVDVNEGNDPLVTGDMNEAWSMHNVSNPFYEEEDMHKTYFEKAKKLLQRL